MTDALLADLENIEKKVMENAGNKIAFSRKCTLIHAFDSIKNLTEKSTEKGTEKGHSERSEESILNETKDVKIDASPSAQHDD
jgi:Zn-finger protein